MANIVVIDSEPTVREVIGRILTRSGHSVRTSEALEQALVMVRELPPDLVVTNVCIKGVPGFDVMGVIRKELPQVLVLMVPGLPDDDAIRRWMGEPGFDVFPKPFTSDALQERVREVLATKDRAPSSSAALFETSGA